VRRKKERKKERSVGLGKVRLKFTAINDDDADDDDWSEKGKIHNNYHRESVHFPSLNAIEY